MYELLLSHCTMCNLGVVVEKVSYVKSLNVSMFLRVLLLSLGLLPVQSNPMVGILEDRLGVY